jgi:hypothetical protein
LAALIAIAGLHVTLASHAIDRTSPTFDEPLHALGGWIHLHHADYRFNPEDPPLWANFAALVWDKSRIDLNTQAPDFVETRDRVDAQWDVLWNQLLSQHDRQPHAFIAAMRWRMLAFAAALIISAGLLVSLLLARSSHRRTFGVVAAMMLALDPNFIAHAPLVKNDIAMTLGFVLLAIALLLIARKITLARVALLGLACGFAASVKFTGVLVAPIVIIVLLARAVTVSDWASSLLPLRRRSTALNKRFARILAASFAILASGLLTLACVWAVYGFRFSAIPGEAGPALGWQKLDERYIIARNTARLARGIIAPPGTPRDDGFVNLVYHLRDAKVLPEGYLFGLYYVHGAALARSSYLLGEISVTGWWYYFPVAMLVKTPSAALVGVGAVIGWWIVRGRRRPAPTTRQVHQTEPATDIEGASRNTSPIGVGFEVFAIALPATLYFITAIGSNLNLGLRHILPVYPTLLAVAALAAADMIRKRLASSRVVLGSCLGVVLIVGAEMSLNAPHHLAFFNTFAGGRERGEELLVDSNLDWGQDLPLLARWQKQNPNVELFLSYFGTADPASYGIRYRNAPPGFMFGRDLETVREIPGRRVVLAISVTHLAGVYNPDRRDWLAMLRQSRRLDTLGGSIALFEIPPRPR